MNHSLVALPSSLVMDNEELWIFGVTWTVGFGLTGVMWMEGDAFGEKFEEFAEKEINFNYTFVKKQFE